MYGFFPNGGGPGEDDALFAWVFAVTQIAFQTMPYVFGLRHFLGWEVEKSIHWVFIGCGLSIAATLCLLSIITCLRWIIDLREYRKAGARADKAQKRVTNLEQ